LPSRHTSSPSGGAFVRFAARVWVGRDGDDSMIRSIQGFIRQNQEHALLSRRAEAISLSDISREPGPTTMSFGYDPAPLQISISNAGMVNSPIVREEINGKATIITGFRRIFAAGNLGWTAVPCRVVSRSEIGDFEGLMLNLHDNLAARPLNEVEKGMVLSRLATHLGNEEILGGFMPLLGLASHYPLFRLYLEMEKELSVEEKGYVAQGSVSLAALKVAMAVEPASRRHLLRALHELRLNINKQLQFIDYIIDISNEKHKNIREILQEPPLDDLWGHTSTNRPQKARAILDTLRSIRYPILSQSEQGFRSSVSRLNLPKGVRIEPPPYFEGPALKMEILFRDGRDLKKKVGHLAQMEGLQTIGPPWEGGHEGGKDE
jgi:hypothetical protein